MPDEAQQLSTRRLRADGERNRSTIIEAAKRAFAERGAGASLEQIARDAGVGIGTLYRHFPTRDVLLRAAYSEERDALVEAAGRLMKEREPVEALRAWLLLFVDFLEAKYGLAEAFGTLMDGGQALYRETPAHLRSPIEALVEAALRSGGGHLDIEPLDILYAISGVANVRHRERWKRSAIGMIDLLLKSLEKAK